MCSVGVRTTFADGTPNRDVVSESGLLPPGDDWQPRFTMNLDGSACPAAGVTPDVAYKGEQRAMPLSERQAV